MARLRILHMQRVGEDPKPPPDFLKSCPMAIYRFSMKHGSRAKGTSAGAHGRYILREGQYAKGSDDLKYSESGNMPEWVKNGGLQFWDAADLYEAENARLAYV